MRRHSILIIALASFGLLLGGGAAEFLKFSGPILIPHLAPDSLGGPTNEPPALVAVSSVGVGDLNGDGKLDLATGFNDVTKRVRYEAKLGVALGHGDGTFETPVHYTLSHYPPAHYGQTFSLLLRDFDGNGELDILTANFSSIGLMLGHGDGTFGFPAHFTPGYSWVDSDWVSRPFCFTELVWGDFNGDQANDVLALSDPEALSIAYSSSSFYLFSRTNDDELFFEREFELGPRESSGETSTNFFFARAGDFNRDGKLDVVAQGGGRTKVLFGNGNDMFETGPEYTNTAGSLDGTWIEVADVNGDEFQDIIIARNDCHDYWALSPCSDAHGSIDVLLGNGLGGFLAPIRNEFGTSPGTLAIADLNGDGILDVISGDGQRTVSILLGHGDGTFFVGSQIPTPDFYPARIATADFNNDSRVDLFVSGWDTNSVSCIFLNDTAFVGTKLAGNSLIVSWPTNLVGWTLQSSTNLALSNWEDSPAIPVIFGTKYNITNTISGPALYFRLRQ